jgi:hypothetical protein
VLVFFDDILIYRKSWEDHVRHVDKVLQLLKEQQLYAKPSKCFFGVKEVVLGVQWLITLGKITTNYQTLEMGFRNSDMKRVVLRGMSIE